MTFFQSISVRAMMIFAAIALMVVGSGAVILLGVQRMSLASQRIVQQGVPVIRSAQRMLLSVQRANEAVTRAAAYQSFADLDDVQQAEADFNGAVLQYELFSAALLLGSDTEAFQTHDGGILFGAWQRRQLDEEFSILPVDIFVRQPIEVVTVSFREFTVTGQAFFRARRQSLRQQLMGDTEAVAETEAQMARQMAVLDELSREMSMHMEKLVMENDTLMAQAALEADRALHPLMATVMASLLITIGMIVLCVMAMRGLILKPIQSLTKAVQAIAGGDLSKRAVVSSSGGEIRVLAEVFNDMAGKLQQSYETLEQKVTLQTNELSNRVLEADEQKRAMLNILEDFEESRQTLERSEEKLRRAKGRIEREAQNAKKFEQAVAASTNAIAILTPDLCISYVNPAWERTTGYSEQEALGQRPSLLMGQQINRSLNDAMVAAAQAGQEFSSDEYTYEHKDGDTYNAEVTMYPVGPRHRPQFFVNIHTDITARKRLEAAKTSFVSLASHQLRTPLTALRWIFDMFHKGKVGTFSSDQQELIDDARVCADHMADTVGTMLMLSRLEAGKVHLEVAECRVAKLFATVWRDQKVTSELKQQHCILSSPEDLQIATDSKLLKEILTNLLSNAIKYTPEGGDITLEAKTEGDRCIIIVKDSGLGIPKQQHDQVFSKFFRADNVVAKQTEGTGLGLYLVSSLVGLLQGEITFESAKDKGTTFRIDLPLTISTHGTAVRTRG